MEGKRRAGRESELENGIVKQRKRNLSVTLNNQGWTRLKQEIKNSILLSYMDGWG